jgi:hypothetical protein
MRNGRAFCVLKTFALLITLCACSLYAGIFYFTESRFQSQEEVNQVLIFLTTHASTSHITFLRTHWPYLLLRSKLLREADVLVFSTGSPELNSELTSTFSLNPNCTVVNFQNPGYQLGANLAMFWGIDSGAFDGYEWIIRLNPDVLILDDTWIHESIRNNDIDAILVDCYDICSVNNCTAAQVLVHTDFFAVRPRVLKKGSFNATTMERIGNAEHVTTYEFQHILSSGRHRWLPGAGPMQANCRVQGEQSPVIHTHDLSQPLPSPSRGQNV